MRTKRGGNNNSNDGKKATSTRVRRKRSRINQKNKRKLEPNTQTQKPTNKSSQRGKPLKRLNVNLRSNNGMQTQRSPRNQRHNKQLPMRQPARPENSYEDQLAQFAAMRNLEPAPSTSISAIPSQELIWVRDNSMKQELQSVPAAPVNSSTVEIDDEIEEGEIVEREVHGIVDLLEESLAAVKQSQRVVDLVSPAKNQSGIFYEDRSSTKYGQVPQYKALGDESIDGRNTSDDVIFLDSTQEEVDDSVIFISEEKGIGPLATPDCLKSPAVNNLLKFVPSQSPINSGPRKTLKKTSPQKKARTLRWKEKKAIEFAAVNALKKIGGAKKEEPMPSTSSAVQSEVAQNEPQKRIILIDGSNLAMGYTDNYGEKKTDKDYSAEGLKIALDHFENLGFQVKAIVPEYRVRRDKSSNQELMNEMKNKGRLVCTPSKAYDDRVILESAMRLDAAVVSNDHFRDLVAEKPEFAEIVSTRLIRFNWLFHQLIIPEDPNGRDGPKLKDILFKKSS